MNYDLDMLFIIWHILLSTFEEKLIIEDDK